VAETPNGADRAKTLTEMERDHILATLETTRWQIEGAGGAASILDINPGTLRSRMRKLGIVRPGSRPAEAPPRADG
jgi:transcriptional regulator with GAF, ATPase, and Fis domain